ncbi:MAG: hypothetical protein CJBNEKGG_00557 [Prosthecobacter sp.]|nr:hypothetical protein [Prosthecobacter sp.]
MLDLPAPAVLGEIARARQQQIQQIIAKRNAHYDESEAQKLDGWADGLKVGLERLIKEARRAAATALTLEEKLASQKQIKTVEAQDAIDQQREDLIGKIEGKLQQAAFTASLFTLRWHLL